MNRIRRLAAILAGLAGALLAVAAVAPAALADPFPPRPPGWDKHPPLPPPGAGIHVVVVGGMPGWQIALIAVGAALLAATVAAGIIAKRDGSPVWRPRAKMSASAPPAGPPGQGAGRDGRRARPWPVGVARPGGGGAGPAGIDRPLGQGDRSAAATGRAIKWPLGPLAGGTASVPARPAAPRSRHTAKWRRAGGAMGQAGALTAQE